MGGSGSRRYRVVTTVVSDRDNTDSMWPAIFDAHLARILLSFEKAPSNTSKFVCCITEKTMKTWRGVIWALVFGFCVAGAWSAVAADAAERGKTRRKRGTPVEQRRILKIRRPSRPTRLGKRRIGSAPRNCTRSFRSRKMHRRECGSGWALRSERWRNTIRRWRRFRKRREMGAGTFRGIREGRDVCGNEGYGQSICGAGRPRCNRDTTIRRCSARIRICRRFTEMRDSKNWWSKRSTMRGRARIRKRIDSWISGWANGM